MIAAAPATGERRRARLRAARLYLVIEGEVRGRPSDDLVAAALAGGVDAVQLRDKHGGDDAVVAAGRRLRGLCHRHGALLIVNDRPDLAVACDADGVHLGQDDVAPAQARRLLGPGGLIGRSTHTPEQVDAALADPDVDYLGVGPVHATETKPGRPAVGTALVRHAAGRAAKPFFAIGGIDAERLAAVRAAGAWRVAAVRAIRDAADPRAAAAALRAGLESERSGGPPR